MLGPEWDGFASHNNTRSMTQRLAIGKIKPSVDGNLQWIMPDNCKSTSPQKGANQNARYHQPDLPVSWSLLTAAEVVGNNRTSPAAVDNIAGPSGVLVTRFMTHSKINATWMTKKSNKANHQYSGREARPENTKYFARQTCMAARGRIIYPLPGGTTGLRPTVPLHQRCTMK